MHTTRFNPYDPQALLPPVGRLVLTAITRDDTSTSQIFAVNADGTCETRLTHTGSSEGSPVWSPDGSRIAFCSDRTGSWNLFTMDGDGQDVRQVTHADPSWPAGLSWAPDGRHIVFSSQRKGDEHALYIIGAGGSRERLLLDDPGTDLSSPAWSPAGDQILFTSGTGQEFSKIEAVRPDGTGRRLLASHGQLNYLQPAWSPDASTIAFVSMGDTRRVGGIGPDILLMTAHGCDMRPISRLPTPGAAPSWSPDGRHIAFHAHSYCEDRDFQVYIMNLDGTGISRPYYYDLGAGPASWGPVYYDRGKGLVKQERVLALRWSP
jgi:TolB protein